MSPENNYNINFNLSDISICSSDSGGFALLSVDTVYITRPSAAQCLNIHGQTISNNEAPKKHLRSRSLELEELKAKAAPAKATAPVEFHSPEVHKQPVEALVFISG